MDAPHRGSRAGCLRLLAAACFWLAACSVDNRTDYGLLLQVDTDLATPKDLDRVHIEIRQSGSTLLDEFYDVGGDALLLPLEIPITFRGDTVPATFEVVGYRSNQSRVQRLAISSIPSSRWAVLHMRLQYLCVGQSAAEGGDGCDEDHTCVQGECQLARLEEAQLPDYQMPVKGATGDVTSTGGVAACFDVLGCFDDPSTALLDPECSFAINPELSGEQLNVALRLARGNLGTCDGGGCYIPFDRGEEGYGFEPGRVALPPIVCERLRTSSEQALAVIFSNMCPAKRAGTAVCAESSETGENNIATGSAGESGLVPNPSTAPACDGGRIKSCGMCGTQERVCKDGTWDEFGACASEGECVVEQTRACDSDGVQTCGGDCRWGECLGQKCRGAASRACERCGTQTRACDNGIWAEWGECSGQRACSPGETQSCGSGGTQACGGNCEWGPCGEQECAGAPTEACGMCGSHARACDPSSGEWSDFGACMDEGVCAPNETRSCGRDGTQICGGNCEWSSACAGQSCEGERSMACGNCGTRTRTCDMTTGNWSDWSPCMGEGVCEPDETRGCGRGGTQVCNGSCRWDDACTGQSCLGANRQGCGNCGQQSRSCDGASGQWSGWSACRDEGACRANSVRSCGSSGTQECSSACAWESTCSGQTCSGESSRPCGRCGLQRRVCDSSTGRYGGWGPCEDEGVCAPDDTRGCGSAGTQTCGDNCQWRSLCTGQVCAEPASRACGNCGRQTSTCDPNTGRANWSTCTGEGQCAPGSTQECGSDGEQVCGADCRWAASCSMQRCLAPRPSPLPCGRCGTRDPVCNSDTGEWTFAMRCSDEGVCTPRDSRDCGPDNTGTQRCGDDCAWDDCIYECSEPLQRDCGFCGTQRGTCDPTTGRVRYEDACRGAGACMPGSTQTCSNSQGSGMRVCSDACAWPTGCTITRFECAEPEGAPCGQYSCGRAGACDTTTGERACVEDESPCEPGSELPCMTSEGSGVRECGLDCEYAATCRITSRTCSEPAGAACGMWSCGTTGTCDTTTGERVCNEPESPCEPGSELACTTSEGSGVRVCGLDCQYETRCRITARVCMQPENAPCGQYNCGRTGDCDPATGTRECVQPQDPCEPGSELACETAEGTGVRTCGDNCRPSGACRITSRVCTQPENAPCGQYNCGRTGDCDPATGTRECVQPDGACVPGSEHTCRTDEGTGVRICGADCRLPDTCTVTARMCTQEAGQPCGMWNCGRTAACNMMTGQRECDMPDEYCQPGRSIDCETEEGTGTRLCEEDCSYAAQCQITSRTCRQPAGEPCGMYACGRTGDCDTSTGQRVCNQRPEPCRPTDRQRCSVAYDGGTTTGEQVCSDSCEWGECEELIIL